MTRWLIWGLKEHISSFSVLLMCCKVRRSGQKPPFTNEVKLLHYFHEAFNCRDLAVLVILLLKIIAFFTDTMLTHLFSMHPFSTAGKHPKTLRFFRCFQGVEKECIGNNWVKHHHHLSRANDNDISLPYVESETSVVSRLRLLPNFYDKW